ncbi:hypothetical protein [Neisseria cinerea]|uniref:hypothetical protein n=1 Tax=Neisseria cinerea TaxID=483 RepID=UPI0027DF64AA|nr:hypothetical protein [Neisseria cinerea]
MPSEIASQAFRRHLPSYGREYFLLVVCIHTFRVGKMAGYFTDFVRLDSKIGNGGFGAVLKQPAVYDVKMPSEEFQTAFRLEGYFMASLIALILWRYMPM